MIKSDFLQELNKKLCEGLPPGLKDLKKDIEKNFLVILQNTFHKLDLVTREEFDAQTRVLARTRKKIESLEEEIQKLEKQCERKK